MLDIGQPKDWWEQVVSDGRRVKLTPILIFSRNRAKDFVMIPYSEDMYVKLSTYGRDVMQTEVTIKNIREEVQSFQVIVTTMDTFSKVDKDYIRHYAKVVDWDNYKEDYQ